MKLKCIINESYSRPSFPLHPFFEHYKDLEEGKWVKVLGWESIDAAHKEILDGIAAYDKQLTNS